MITNEPASLLTVTTLAFNWGFCAGGVFPLTVWFLISYRGCSGKGTFWQWFSAVLGAISSSFVVLCGANLYDGCIVAGVFGTLTAVWVVGRKNLSMVLRNPALVSKRQAKIDSSNKPTLHPWQSSALILAGRLLVAFTLVDYAILFTAINFDRNKVSEHITTMPLYPGLFNSIPIFLISSAGVHLARRGRRKQAVSGYDLMQRDRRPPVVYLRSFSADAECYRDITVGSVGFSVSWEQPTPEEDLASVWSAYGPFIAIGKPGEELPELGAARIYVSNDQWKNEVRSLIAKAQVVILRAGITNGFMWELEHVLHCLSPQRVLLYLPPEMIGGTQDKREECFTSFREQTAKCLIKALPDVKGCRFIAFGDAWDPLPYPTLRRYTTVLGSQKLNMKKELAGFFERLKHIQH